MAWSIELLSLLLSHVIVFIFQRRLWISCYSLSSPPPRPPLALFPSLKIDRMLQNDDGRH